MLVRVVVRVSELYARPGVGGVREVLRVLASYARPRVLYTGILLFWGVSVYVQVYPYDWRIIVKVAIYCSICRL